MKAKLGENLDEFIELQLPDTLPDALRSELIMSLIQPEEFGLGEETVAVDNVETKDKRSAVDLFEEVGETKVHSTFGKNL